MQAPHNMLDRFARHLRSENPRVLREECSEIMAAGIDYRELAKIIWAWISEKAVADPRWLPAASCVNFADSFAMVGIQKPEDQFRQILFGEPPSDFRRAESPTPLEGPLEDLQNRLAEIAATNDWLLTERCLLGIASLSDVRTLLHCLIEQLLRPEYLGSRSNAWWTELRLVTARCIVEIGEHCGDDAILSVACRVGARLCARKTSEANEQKQEAMRLVIAEYSKLETGPSSESTPTFDEASFRQQLDTGEVATMFAAITHAWNSGATVAQIDLAITMHCVERILHAASGEGASWPNLRNELMAAANIRKLAVLDPSYSVRAAYHAVWLLHCDGKEGFAEQVSNSSQASTDLIANEADCMDALLKAVRNGKPGTAMAIANSYAASEFSGLEFLRRFYLRLGHDFTYAGQRCMIEAWHIAENHPERGSILAAAVGWEAHWRRHQDPQ